MENQDIKMLWDKIEGLLGVSEELIRNNLQHTSELVKVKYRLEEANNLLGLCWEE